MLELILIGSLSAELTESNVVKKFNVAQVLGSIFYVNQYLGSSNYSSTKH